MISLQAAALAYAAHGYHVFPLRPHSKEPLTSNGFRAATTDAPTVARWWAQEPDANIGLHPGPSGFVVVDVDGPEGRAAAIPLGLFSEPTLAVLTGRAGGVHLYYRHPGFPVSNRPLAPHLDVRADDGYVLLPPSIHPAGPQYRWDKSPVLALPVGCLHLLQNGSRPRSAAPLAPLEPIPEGQRNTALTSLAGSMRRRGMEALEIAPALHAVNAARCRPPLRDDEVEAIAASVAQYPAVTLVARSATVPSETVAVRNARIAEQARRSSAQPADARSWGWEVFDERFGLLVPGWMYAIGARPSNGKTSLLLNILSHCWESGTRTLYFGTEMAANQLVVKWAALRLGFNELRVFEGRLPTEHREVLVQEQDRLLATGTVTFCEASRLTLDRLVGEVAWAATALRPTVVILDHLHRMTQDRDELATVATELKTLAVEQHVALLVAAQLNRDEQEKVFDLYYPPTMGRYKGSAAIEENADVGLGLFRPLRSGVTAQEMRAVARGVSEVATLAKASTMAVVCMKHRYAGAALGRFCELDVYGSKLTPAAAPSSNGSMSTREPGEESDAIPF